MKIQQCRSTAFGGVVLGLVCTAWNPAHAGELSPFTEEAAQRGVNYSVRSYSGTVVQYFGYGSAIADFNNNGYQDLLMLGSPTGQAGLFENDGTGHFTDRSANSGIPVMARPSGVAVADFNGNGKLDIYITQDIPNIATMHSEPNLLMRNEGNFTFINVGPEAGVANTGRGQGAAWGDLENNGWLDLYVANWTHPNTPPSHHNHLYRNLGDETFEDIAVQHGVNSHANSFIGVWSDINRNGWLDLYLVNDRPEATSSTPNRLWRNDSGILVDISESSGANIGIDGMGAACGDFSGNGYPDFYCSNTGFNAYQGVNPLLINQGDETFIDQTIEAGTWHQKFSWATVFFDATNNTHLDLYVANMFFPNSLYINEGHWPLTDRGSTLGLGGGMNRSFSAAVGDVTGNGALDILVNDQALPGPNALAVKLFINQEGIKRNWIRFRVVGDAPNHFAIGSNIELRTGEQWQWRELHAGGNNYKSQNELVFHFGVDEAEIVDELIVNWPGKIATRTLKNYPANQVWTIYPLQRLGDFTGDGRIGKDDLMALIDAWGPVQPGVEMLDLNGDAKIDVSDLLMLLARWTGPR